MRGRRRNIVPPAFSCIIANSSEFPIIQKALRGGMRTPRRGKRLLQAYFFVLQTCWMQNTSAYPGPVCEGGDRKGKREKTSVQGREQEKKSFFPYVQEQSKGMAVLPPKRLFRRKEACRSGYGRGRKSDGIGQAENR